MGEISLLRLLLASLKRIAKRSCVNEND